jgi:uncharacterized protein (DUF1778 family)
MTEINTDKTDTLSIKVSSDERIEIDRAWKQRDDCMSRSQFIKRAVNAYAGKKIIEVK